MLCGVWMVVAPIILPTVRSRRVSRRYRGYRQGDGVKRKKGKARRHLERLLAITVNNKTSYAFLSFLIVSGLLFVLTILFCLNTGQSWKMTVVAALAFGLMPYAILQLRLYTIRLRSSYEGVPLVTELISQYKMNWFNMIEAIDRTVPYLKNEPYTRRALFRMALELKQYRNNEELDEIVQEFVYSINTEWSRLLGNNIYLSIGHKDNVQIAMEDILDELKDLKNIMESDKRENAESFLMIKYLAPGLYLLGAWATIEYFGFTFGKFIDYQFKNPAGFKYFIVTMLFNVGNFILYFFIRRPKNDF